MALSLLSPLGTELVASPRSPTGFHASLKIPLLERVRLTRRQRAGHLRVAHMCAVVTQRTPRVTRGIRSLVLTADNPSVGRIRNAVCIVALPHGHRIGWPRGIIAYVRLGLSSALPPRVNANSLTSPACRPARQGAETRNRHRERPGSRQGQCRRQSLARLRLLQAYKAVMARVAVHTEDDQTKDYTVASDPAVSLKFRLTGGRIHVSSWSSMAVYGWSAFAASSFLTPGTYKCRSTDDAGTNGARIALADISP